MVTLSLYIYLSIQKGTIVVILCQIESGAAQSKVRVVNCCHKLDQGPLWLTTNFLPITTWNLFIQFQEFSQEVMGLLSIKVPFRLLQ